ncbi:MAG: hydroxymethylglutaryl-CoA lyase [Flavobacteriales bacterium]|nr:MAG: hydroxymethylglutaryl-CoA lyase [Flavobacteriales bacterium]
MEKPQVKLIECPRDAMQGLHDFIPTDVKVRYLDELLKVGFDTIDIGSFVSAKAIPQLADTTEVLARIGTSESKLLVIVANERGAEDACKQERVTYLGYPFSISETFQQRNTNTSIEGSWQRTARIAEMAQASGKELVVYISMAFGNPYGDPWNADIALKWTDRLVNELGVRIISLADTVGVAQPEDVGSMFSALIPAMPHVEFGAHLHARLDNWKAKTDAAWNAGCRRFDGALKGYGGCPMAEDDLVGNLAMELFVGDLEQRGTRTGLDLAQLQRCVELAAGVFPAAR